MAPTPPAPPTLAQKLPSLGRAESDSDGEGPQEEIFFSGQDHSALDAFAVGGGPPAAAARVRADPAHKLRVAEARRENVVDLPPPGLAATPEHLRTPPESPRGPAPPGVGAAAVPDRHVLREGETDRWLAGAAGRLGGPAGTLEARAESAGLGAVRLPARPEEEASAADLERAFRRAVAAAEAEAAAAPTVPAPFALEASIAGIEAALDLDGLIARLEAGEVELDNDENDRAAAGLLYGDSEEEGSPRQGKPQRAAELGRGGKAAEEGAARPARSPSARHRPLPAFGPLGAEPPRRPEHPRFQRETVVQDLRDPLAAASGSSGEEEEDGFEDEMANYRSQRRALKSQQGGRPAAAPAAPEARAPPEPGAAPAAKARPAAPESFAERLFQRKKAEMAARAQREEEERRRAVEEEEAVATDEEDGPEAAASASRPAREDRFEAKHLGMRPADMAGYLKDFREEAQERNQEKRMFEKESAKSKKRHADVWASTLRGKCPPNAGPAFDEAASFGPDIPGVAEEKGLFTLEVKLSHPTHVAGVLCWALAHDPAAADSVGPAEGPAFAVAGLAVIAPQTVEKCRYLDSFQRRLLLVCRPLPAAGAERADDLGTFLKGLRAVLQRTRWSEVDGAQIYPWGDERAVLTDSCRIKPGCHELLKPTAKLPFCHQHLGGPFAPGECCVTLLSGKGTSAGSVRAILETALAEGFDVVGLRSYLGGGAAGRPLQVALCVRGADGRRRWTELVGPDDFNLAKVTDPASLRARLGLDEAEMSAPVNERKNAEALAVHFGGRVTRAEETAGPGAWTPADGSEETAVLCYTSTCTTWVGISAAAVANRSASLFSRLAEVKLTINRLVTKGAIKLDIDAGHPLRALAAKGPVLLVNVSGASVFHRLHFCFPAEHLYVPDTSTEVHKLAKLLEDVDCAPSSKLSSKLSKFMKALKNAPSTKKVASEVACVALFPDMARCAAFQELMDGPGAHRFEILGAKSAALTAKAQRALFVGVDREGQMWQKLGGWKTTERVQGLKRAPLLVLYRGFGLFSHLEGIVRATLAPKVRENVVLGATLDREATAALATEVFKDTDLILEAAGKGKKNQPTVLQVLKGPPKEDVVFLVDSAFVKSGKLEPLLRSFFTQGFVIMACKMAGVDAELTADLNIEGLREGSTVLAFCLRDSDAVTRLPLILRDQGATTGAQMWLPARKAEATFWLGVFFPKLASCPMPCDLIRSKGLPLEAAKRAVVAKVKNAGLLETACVVLGPLNASGAFWEDSKAAAANDLTLLTELISVLRKDNFRVSNIDLLHTGTKVSRHLKEMYPFSPEDSKEFEEGTQVFVLAVSRQNCVGRLQMTLQTKNRAALTARSTKQEILLSKVRYSTSSKNAQRELPCFFDEVFDAAFTIDNPTA